MNHQIDLSKTTTFLGRNGYLKMKGVDLIRLEYDGHPVVEIAPITTKGLVGRGFVQIPVADIEGLITILQKFIKQEVAP